MMKSTRSVNKDTNEINKIYSCKDVKGAAAKRNMLQHRLIGTNKSDCVKNLHGSLAIVVVGTLGALASYLAGYFWRNEAVTPLDSYKRILSTVSPHDSAFRTEQNSTVSGPSLAGCSISTLFADEPVHGMHLGCIQHTPTGLYATMFMDGQNHTRREVIASMNDFQGLRTLLGDRLGLAPVGRRNGEGPRDKETPNTQKPWSMFSPQGIAIDSLLDLQEGANDVLLYEGGKFIWPGVREGYVTQVTALDRLGSVKMQTLSMSPLVFSVENFLLPEECTYIRDVAEPHMRQSGVKLMDHDKGKAATDWRTSSTHFLASKHHARIQSVDRRVAGLTRQPVSHQEDVQVLRYESTQRYDAHHDFFDRRLYARDPDTLKLIDNGKRNRMATVLWYLSDVLQGGETIFPRYKGGEISYDSRHCERMKGALRCPPKEGSVIIFYSLLPNGDLDDRSLHGSCAVKHGVKWAANKWIWSDEIAPILGRA